MMRRELMYTISDMYDIVQKYCLNEIKMLNLKGIYT